MPGAASRGNGEAAEPAATAPAAALPAENIDGAAAAAAPEIAEGSAEKAPEAEPEEGDAAAAEPAEGDAAAAEPAEPAAKRAAAGAEPLSVKSAGRVQADRSADDADHEEPAGRGWMERDRLQARSSLITTWIRSEFGSDTEQGPVNQAVSNVVETVRRVRSWIPPWRRALNEVLKEASKDPPDRTALQHLLQEADLARSDKAAWSPKAACKEFADRDAASRSLSARLLVGEHADHLTVDLMEADRWWPEKDGADTATPDFSELAANAQRTLDALGAALQHALLLTFLSDADAAGVGTSSDLADYCTGWELTTEQVDTTWLWLTHDSRQFGDRPLRLFIDTEHRLVYRKAARFSPEWWATTLTPLWGGVLVYGLVVGLFALLHTAGLTKWPSHAPVKMIVLLVFVALGAGMHVASRSLSAINYDDPLKVYVASQSLDWLSLRWIGVLRAYIPITFVLATLWGAGNIPTAFQQLSTAILAGYSADSLFRASISKVQAKSRH